ncbi:uncharacterized protein LOC115210419 isoform X4 [Octopus sinensis]|uniref:Uncharacterized protein LOC115210419 isoform X4 n=1 Tax=Octopus sinensis TaxID=2607531 RepID=A0A7E6ETU9_9MOLL|nr:uncharacterized protein LOC115210419 isoform X4 [Octopus sinensis]
MVVLLGSPDFSIETSVHSPVAFAYSLSILYLVSSFISVLSDGLQASHLICRQCGHEVAHTDDLVHIPSSLALRQRNDTIQSKDKTIVQLFQNPEDSTMRARSSAYSSSHGLPVLNFSVIDWRTMMNRRGLRTKPW